MKYLLLLPDFSQSGEIMVWSDDMQSPVPISSCDDIPLRELPDCFVLGIPESLLRTNFEKNFVYAQYARLKSSRSIVSFSIRGGNDKSGRTVVLTIIQLLNEGDALNFPPKFSSCLPGSVAAKNEIEARVHTMVDLLKLNSPKNIRDMIQAVAQNPKLRSFASEYSSSLYQKPQWTPHKKKEYNFLIGLLAVFMLLVFFVVAML